MKTKVRLASEVIMEANDRTPRVDGQEQQVTVTSANRSEAPAVSSEERRHLAECCAFFKAEHYREAQPGAIRESDVRKAEEEIERVIKNCASDFQSPDGT